MSFFSALFGQNRFRAETPQLNQAAFQNPNAQQTQQQIAQRLANADLRQAPTAQAAQIGPLERVGPLGQGIGANLQNVQGTQGQQQALAQQLLAEATGQAGPSLAEQQLRSGLAANLAAQRAQAASQTGGGSPALLARQLQSGIAGAGIEAQGQAALLRAQEQQQAQSALANLLAQQGQLGLGAAGLQQQGQIAGAQLGAQGQLFNAAQANQAALQQAGFGQQANISNLQSALQTQSQQDALVQFLVSQGVGIDEANRQAQIAMQQMQAQNQLQTQAINAGIQGQNVANASRLFGGVLGGLAGAATAGILRGGR